MALSPRKKKTIIAEWKAGKFKSFYAVSKQHKISEHTAKKLLGEVQQSNADIVEAGVVYEQGKKFSKSAVETDAIEKEVRRRTELQKTKDLIEEVALKSTLKNVVKISPELNKDNLSSSDRNNHQRTLKAALEMTQEKKDGTNININNTNAQQTNIHTKNFNDFYDED